MCIKKSRQVSLHHEGANWIGILTSLMILALGSKLRYTRCPNPNSFSFFDLTPAMKAGMFSTFRRGEGESSQNYRINYILYFLREKNK